MYRKKKPTLRLHILKILHEYNPNSITVSELARRVDEIGEYKGSMGDLDNLTRSIRFVLEILRLWGKVKRETCQQKFGGGIGSTPKYVYSISPAGVGVLERRGII